MVSYRVPYLLLMLLSETVFIERIFTIVQIEEVEFLLSGDHSDQRVNAA